MKFYKFLKAYDGHAAGAEVELDESLDVTKQLAALKVIEESGEPADAVSEQLVESLVEKVLAKSQERLTKAASKGPRVELVEAEEDRAKSCADWLQCVGLMEHPHVASAVKEKTANKLAKLYKSPMVPWGESKAANQFEASGPAGGYAAPPQYSADWFKLAVENTVFLSRVRRLPMASNTLFYPKLDQTGTAVAGTTTGYLGGVLATWQGEQANTSLTGAKIKQGQIKAGELRLGTIVTNEVLQDAPVLEAMLREIFVEAIRYYSELATIQGDGVDKPIGIIGANAAISQNRSGGANTFVYADAVAMEAQTLSEGSDRYIWLMHPTVKPQLYQMKDGSNRLIFMPNFPGMAQGSATVRPPQELLGHPIYFTEKVSTLGTKGDVILVDPQGYRLGERMGLEIAASPHANFMLNEMTYRCIARVGGQPVLDKPFTLLDGASQLSNIVVLN